MRAILKLILAISTLISSSAYPVMKSNIPSYQSISKEDNVHDISMRGNIGQTYNPSLASNNPVTLSSSGPKQRISSSLMVALITYTVISGMAYTHLLPNHGVEYIPSAVARDQVACIVTFLGATIFVKGCTYAAKHNILESKDTRKIIHTFSAPFYLCCWPLFSSNFAARFFACVVMVAFNFRIWIAGTTTTTAKTSTNNQPNDFGEESELANAISRSGDAREAIEGPFIYGFNVLIGTLLFWRDNLIGIIAISIMAAGDGAADLVGRRWETNNKWPFRFCRDKSLIGSLAFILASTIASIGISWLMISTDSLIHDYHAMRMTKLFCRIAIICFISAFVELVPFGNDNITVPLIAAVLSFILLS